jgi:transposase-like protein
MLMETTEAAPPRQVLPVSMGDRLKIAALSRAGKRAYQIAADLKRPYATVRCLLLKAGLPTAPPLRFVIPAEMQAEIVKRLQRRESQASIARRFGIDIKRIRRVARAHGIHRLKQRENYHLSPEMRERIAKARGNPTAVARRFQVSSTTVLRARRKYRLRKP